MIGFRVDANETIATGHLMRCISIAIQIRKQGKECIFFLAEEKCVDILTKNNFSYIILNSDWNNLEKEIDQMKALIIEKKLEWLIVDSYQATPLYCEQLNHITKTMVLDADESCIYKVSAILNYSHLDDEDKVKELYQEEQTDLLLGLKYAPLRQEFFQENRTDFIRKQIMITTGGTDPYRIAYKLSQIILTDKRFLDYTLCVVLGKMCTDKQSIEQLDVQRVKVLQNISNMSQIMRESEVVMSAGGSTSIELCACQTPTVCFSFVDNQIAFSKVLNEKGIIEYVGDIRDGEEMFLKKACEALYRMTSSEDRRTKIKKKMKEICDGEGAKRVAEYCCISKGL